MARFNKNAYYCDVCSKYEADEYMLEFGSICEQCFKYINDNYSLTQKSGDEENEYQRS